MCSPQLSQENGGLSDSVFFYYNPALGARPKYFATNSSVLQRGANPSDLFSVKAALNDNRQDAVHFPLHHTAIPSVNPPGGRSQSAAEKHHQDTGEGL